MALCLMYHNFVENEEDKAAFPRPHRRYVLTRTQFEKHLEVTEALNLCFLKPSDVLQEGRLDPDGVLLTFDDSWEGQEWAASALAERGISGIFFLNSGNLGASGMLSGDAVRSLADAGQEIGSHGVTHRFMTQMPCNALRASLGDSKADLEATGGREVRFMAVPGGRCDARVLDIARRAGYRGVFTSRPGFLSAVSSGFALNRMAVTADINSQRLMRILARPRLYLGWRLARYGVLSLERIFTEKRGGRGA